MWLNSHSISDDNLSWTFLFFHQINTYNVLSIYDIETAQATTNGTGSGEMNETEHSLLLIVVVCLEKEWNNRSAHFMVG